MTSQLANQWQKQKLKEDLSHFSPIFLPDLIGIFNSL
jgi:hypothetical protein